MDAQSETAQPETKCGGDNGPAQSTLSQFSLLEPHATAGAFPAFDEESLELLHELNNVFVGVLLNTQVMEWKLPSYSRLKRNLHEVQRSAQRGGELTKRLLNRLQAMSREGLHASHCGTALCDSVAANGAVTEQEPEPAIPPDDTRVELQRYAAPVLSASGRKVPHTPV